MEAKGLVSTAADENAFRALMDRAIEEPDELTVVAHGGDVAESVARFGDLVADLLAGKD
jgi:hypothetical protein